MTVAVWRLPVAGVGLLVALILLLEGAAVEGVVVASAIALWFIDHARPPESLGVRFLHRRAAFEYAKASALALLVIAAFAAMIVGFALGWNHDAEGPVLYAALAGVMVLLMRELEQHMLQGERFVDGGTAEIEVGTTLDGLDAFNVEHNWLRPDGFGNVDHIVQRQGDGAWFAIETKSGWFRAQNASQAIGNALAVKKRLNARWVTPVVCVGKARDPVREHRQGASRVWVVRRDHLASWLPAAPSTQSYR